MHKIHRKLLSEFEKALVRRSSRRNAALRDPVEAIRTLVSNPRVRIAVVVRDHLGGLMLAVPVLRALRQRYPLSTITVITNQYALPALAGCPYVDSVLGFYKFNGNGRMKGLRRLRHIASKAWTVAHLFGRIDLTLHLRYVGGETLLLHELLGAKAQVGYDQGLRSEILTLNLGVKKAGRSVREWNIDELEVFGLSGVAQDLEVWTSPEDKLNVDILLSSRGTQEGRRFICLHPGAHWGCNEWMPERWAALGDEIYELFGLTAVITGTNKDEKLAQAIAMMMIHKPIILTGKTTFGGLAEIYRRSEVVIGIDSLPRQVCQALKQRCVILFGAGDPTWFAPLPDEPMIVINKNRGIVNVDMSEPNCETWNGSCHNPCCDIRPLEIIEVEDVLEAVGRLLWIKPACSPIWREGPGQGYHPPQMAVEQVIGASDRKFSSH